jgi:SAM-dependent methyltransferase
MEKVLEPYEQLSQVYEKDWSYYSLRYKDVIRYIKGKYDLHIVKILDITCGTGNLINELKQSYIVVGADISPFMIEKARELNPEITFYIADIAELKINEKFDIIISPFDSINYLIEDSHMNKSLKNIGDHLVDKGCFLFDFNSHRLFKEKHKGIFDREFECLKFQQICEYDTKTRIGKTTFNFGDIGKEVHIQKGYLYEEMKDLLQKNNFNIITIFNGYDFKEVKENDETLEKIIVLAQKKDQDYI